MGFGALGTYQQKNKKLIYETVYGITIALFYIDFLIYNIAFSAIMAIVYLNEYLKLLRISDKLRVLILAIVTGINSYIFILNGYHVNNDYPIYLLLLTTIFYVITCIFRIVKRMIVDEVIILELFKIILFTVLEVLFYLFDIIVIQLVVSIIIIVKRRYND